MKGPIDSLEKINREMDKYEWENHPEHEWDIMTPRGGSSTAVHQPKYIEFYRNGFSIGRNKRDRWYWSGWTRWRGPKLEYEWHNYPKSLYMLYGSDVLYLSVAVGLRNHRNSKLNIKITVWPPETGRFAAFLRRHFKATVYRRY